MKAKDIEPGMLVQVQEGSRKPRASLNLGDVLVAQVIEVSAFGYAKPGDKTGPMTLIDGTVVEGLGRRVRRVDGGQYHAVRTSHLITKVDEVRIESDVMFLPSSGILRPWTSEVQAEVLAERRALHQKKVERLHEEALRFAGEIEACERAQRDLAALLGERYAQVIPSSLRGPIRLDASQAVVLSGSARLSVTDVNRIVRAAVEADRRARS